MPDTGAPWNIPYVDPTDLVRDYPQASEDLADAIADGLDAAGNAGIGSNVVQTYRITTFTTTSTSYVDITDFNVTITPSSNTSKVLLIVTGALSLSVADLNQTAVQFVRGSTVIGNTADNQFYRHFAASNNNLFQNVATLLLDSPATDSPVTYKVQILATAHTATFGRTGGSTSAMASSLTAIEVEV
jgi:hypothetical protein